VTGGEISTLLNFMYVSVSKYYIHNYGYISIKSR
jgi:hypothetical protein